MKAKIHPPSPLKKKKKKKRFMVNYFYILKYTAESMIKCIKIDQKLNSQPKIYMGSICVQFIAINNSRFMQE